MFPKLLQIIVLVSFAMFMVHAETSKEEQESNTSLGKEHIISPQNVISIRFDQSKPVVIQLESVPSLEDVIENKLKKLESILLQRLEYIARNLSSLVNKTCDTVLAETIDVNRTQQIPVTNQSKSVLASEDGFENKPKKLEDILLQRLARNQSLLVNKTCDTVRAESIDVNSAQQIPVTNQSRAISLSECKKEEKTVSGDLNGEFDPFLLGFDPEVLRHVLRRPAGGRSELLHMRFGLQELTYAHIILSTGRYPGLMLRFNIEVMDDGTGMYTWENGHISALNRSDTILLFGLQPAFLLTLYEDGVELRREPSAAPFLEHRDPRYGDVKYFAFLVFYKNAAHRNTSDVTVYYDCQNDLLST